MNIHTKPGTKVKFEKCTKAQAEWGGNDDANLYLVKDQEYTVLKTEIHSQHTKVILAEFPERKFNSVCFY